ncbi:MAG: hypothetical protein ABI863_03440 [Ginsengibacter sp.]
MKRIIIPALSAILFMSIASCKKENSATATTGASLTASKTSSIKKGESVLFTLNNSAGASVNWHVSPATSAQVNATGANASVMFASGGTYTITAVSGGSTDSSIVTVSDSVYAPPVPNSTLPFTGNEQINIKVYKLDSAAYSGLILFAQTTNSYTCLSNYLIGDLTTGTNAYTIDFAGVSVPAGCTPGTAKAGTFEYFIPMAEGSNTLTISFNGTTYTGSIVKAGSIYTINWSYTSGVTIGEVTTL